VAPALVLCCCPAAPVSRLEAPASRLLLQSAEQTTSPSGIAKTNLSPPSTSANPGSPTMQPEVGLIGGGVVLLPVCLLASC
jgi:hypothetical protein